MTNTGDTPAVETVQPYVRELEGFQRHEVAAGASVRVNFTLENQDLAFFDGVDWATEPGEFEVWVAPNATSGETGSFILLEVEPR